MKQTIAGAIVDKCRRCRRPVTGGDTHALIAWLAGHGYEAVQDPEVHLRCLLAERRRATGEQMELFSGEGGEQMELFSGEGGERA